MLDEMGTRARHAQVTNERMQCLTLGLTFVLAPGDGLPIALRLADGDELLPTGEEAERREVVRLRKLLEERDR